MRTYAAPLTGAERWPLIPLRTIRIGCLHVANYYQHPVTECSTAPFALQLLGAANQQLAAAICSDTADRCFETSLQLSGKAQMQLYPFLDKQHKSFQTCIAAVLQVWPGVTHSSLFVTRHDDIIAAWHGL